MSQKEERAALYLCKQANGRYRKEIENSGVFLSEVSEMDPYIAMQPHGQWQSFDYEPTLTEHGWLRQGDRPTDLVVEGDLGIPWEKSLCYNERYKPKILRLRKTFRVDGF